MICSNCGYENRSGARFCANCGTLLAPAVPPAPSSPVTVEEPVGQTANPVDAPAFSPAVPASGAVESAAGNAAAGATGAAVAQNVGSGQGAAAVNVEAAGGTVSEAAGEITVEDGAAVNPSSDSAADAAAAWIAAPPDAAAENGSAARAPSTGDADAELAAVPDAGATGASAVEVSAVEASTAGMSTAEPVDEPLSSPVQFVDDGAAAVPAAEAPTNQPPLPLLEPGTLVAERFLVISADEEPTGRRYLVEDRGVCVACGSLVTASAEEQYCFECGAYLLDENAQFPTRLLRQLPEADAVADAEADAEADVIAWQGMFFSLVEQEPSATGVQTGAPSDALSGAGEAAPPAFHHGVVLLAGQRSDPGLLRAGAPDEDSIFALTLTAVYESQAQPTIGLYLVADGMGGHGDGEVASRIAADAVSAALMQTVVIPLLQGQVIAQETIGALLDAAIVAANRRVYDNARARGNDMGTTLTLALVIDDQAYIANVGDSRTYLWRQGELQQITEDHSAVYQLVRKGILQPEEIYTHPQRNQITRNLGFRPSVQVDYFHQPLAPHDALLLCCDGLWEMLHDEGIADVLLTNFGDVQTVCDALVKRANQAGGEDNISVVLVRVEA